MAEPAYAFTLPSVHDDTPLDCRIYHPKKLQKSLRAVAAGQRTIKGAVVAHPYAPLGGSFDDAVVLSVTESLLEQQFVVATFNFRGAGDSAGSTSWSGKAEQDDYVSIAGFLIYYLQNLRSYHGSLELETILSTSIQTSTDTGLQPKPHSLNDVRIELLLAGYSYGSLVLARLPSSSAIIARYEAAEIGTSAAEIILRARTLAKETQRIIEPLQSPQSPRGRPLDAESPTQRAAASPVTVGGEESDLSSRRRSRDSKRSIDVPHRIKAHIRRPSTPKSVNKYESGSTTPVLSTGRNGAPSVSTRYLLISPVLLPFTLTLCPPGPPSSVFNLRNRKDASSGTVFLDTPTLTLFGSADVFTSSRRLKGWAEKQAKDSKSSFKWFEIETAGHFWQEDGVMQILQQRIGDWVKPNVT